MRALLCFMIASSLWGQVTFNRILNANKEPQNWLTYSGTELSQRHSLLTQITPANVKNLELQWVFQARSLEKFEATPATYARAVTPNMNQKEHHHGC